MGVNLWKGQNEIRRDGTCRELALKWPSLHKSYKDMWRTLGRLLDQFPLTIVLRRALHAFSQGMSN